MNILFVIYGSENQLSGGYLYDRTVVSYCRDHGDTVKYLQLPPPGRLARLRCGPGRLLLNIVKDSQFDAVIIDALVSPDVPVLLASLSASVHASLQPPSIVSLFHMLFSGSGGYTSRRRMYAEGEKVLISASDLIIANSDTTRMEIMSIYKGTAPIAVCRPGKDAQGKTSGSFDEIHEHRRRKTGGTVELLAVGNVVPGKGFHDLIIALSGIRSIPWTFTIAGSLRNNTRYVRKIEELVRTEGVSGRVCLAGECSPEKLERLYRDSDIFLQASSHESYGISMAEAQHFGLPVIAFNTGAVSEVCTNGFEIRGSTELEQLLRKPCATGSILIPSNDKLLFRSAVRFLMNEPSFREILSRYSYESGSRLPSWEQTSSDFFRAIHTLR